MREKTKTPTDERLEQIKDYQIVIDFNLGSTQGLALTHLHDELVSILKSNPHPSMGDVSEVICETEEFLKRDGQKMEEFLRTLFNIKSGAHLKKAKACGCMGVTYNNIGTSGLIQKRGRMKGGASMHAKAIRLQKFDEKKAKECLEGNHELYRIDHKEKILYMPLLDIAAVRGIGTSQAELDRIVDGIYTNSAFEVMEDEMRLKPTYVARHLTVRDDSGIVREVQLIDTYYDWISSRDRYHEGDEKEGSGKYALELEVRAA